MRILSNDLVKFIEAQSGLSKEDKTLAKLIALLEESSDKSLTLNAQVKLITPDKQRLVVEGLGAFEVAMLDTPPTGDVTLRAKLVEGRIQLQVDTPQPNVAKASLPAEPVKVGSSAANWLDQLKLPKSEHFLEAAQLLENYKIEPSAEKIKLLAEGSFLASKLKHTAPERLNQLIEQLGERLADLSNNETVNFKQMAVEMLHIHDKPEMPLQRPGVVGQEGIAAESQKASVMLAQDDLEGHTEAVPKQTMTNNLRAILKDFDVKQLITMLSSGDYSIDNLDLHKKIFINQEIGNRKHEILEALKVVLSKDQIEEGFKQQLTTWIESGENPVDEQQLTLLKQVVQNNEQAFPKEFKEQIEHLLKATEQLSKLPDFMSGIHMPLTMGEHNNQLEVYYKKRQQRGMDEPFRMLIALNTEHYSQVKVLVTDTPRTLSIHFKLVDESARMVFESEKNELLGLIETVAQKPVVLTFEESSSELPVLEAMKFLGTDANSQFDARV